MLTTLALMIVVMGLMVSLARYVRAESADQLTRRILVELDQSLAMYQQWNGAYPRDGALAPGNVDEAQLSGVLQQANRLVLQALRDASSTPPAGARASVLGAESTIRDAWGRPIGYLPSQHPMIGMAPQNRPFFFSAGPDGKYLTRQDNLYSYEQSPPASLPGESIAPKTLDKANNADGGE